MQARLEDVLGEKERELKLYQRFLDLKTLCEEEVFPSAGVPLKQHAEDLTSIIERIIPDPRDRKEELFSGEIFALLGAAYLHDAGLAGYSRWVGDEGILGGLDIGHKRFLVTAGIGMELGIPDKAIDVINYLSSSSASKRMPMEWVITEEGKKALIRNTKVIEHLFNFSHFILDVFYTDINDGGLRKYPRPKLALGGKEVAVEINSREGAITVAYQASSPYESHQFETARDYVERAFKIFKDNVNGRLGLQYKEFRWDVSRKSDIGTPFSQRRIFSPFAGGEALLLERWPDASALLDRMLANGSAIMVGDESVGKSTLLKYFVLPEAEAAFTHAFYCEVWESPVREIKDQVCAVIKDHVYSDVDIISLCTRLLAAGPTVFILDGFERTIDLEQEEREKLQRFVDFCFAREQCYVILSGDKETFFDWSGPFRRIAMSALYELKALDRPKAAAHYGVSTACREAGIGYTPVECELLSRGITIEDALDCILRNAEGIDELRPLLAVLTGGAGQRHLKRYTVDEICFETRLRAARVLAHLGFLVEKGLVSRDDSSQTPVFSLASRFLRRPIFQVLSLTQFLEKVKARDILKQSSLDDSLLDRSQLELVLRWNNGMVFSREGMGKILASLVFLGEDCSLFLEKARHDNSGIDIQPILGFINSDDQGLRERSIKLLLEIGGKNMVNPLLRRLKIEPVPEIKELIIKGVCNTKRKRRIVAVMRALREAGDREMKLRALGLLRNLPVDMTKGLLAELLEVEDDPAVVQGLKTLLISRET